MIINIALLEDEIKEQEKTIELLNRFAKENECEFAIDFFEKAHTWRLPLRRCIVPENFIVFTNFRFLKIDV